MNSVDRLLGQAVVLSEDQRLSLVHRLLDSLEPRLTSDVEQAWDAEIRSRIKRYDQGETRSRPADQAFAELNRRLGA